MVPKPSPSKRISARNTAASKAREKKEQKAAAAADDAAAKKQAAKDKFREMTQSHGAALITHPVAGQTAVETRLVPISGVRFQNRTPVDIRCSEISAGVRFQNRTPADIRYYGISLVCDFKIAHQRIFHKALVCDIYCQLF
jgi:hypothetical protein